MKPIYFTITGTNFHFGDRFLEPGMQVNLEKEPENDHDKEAIKVTLPGLGTIGYVANSHRTVIGESFSAGRMYDKIEDIALGTVLYKLDYGILCVLSQKEAGKADDCLVF